MPVTLQKWGHSIGVRLPKPMLEQVGLTEGAQVDVLEEGDHLVIRRTRRRPTLDELLDQCKPENRPQTIDFGPPVGRKSSDGPHRLCAGAWRFRPCRAGSSRRAGAVRRAPGARSHASTIQ